MILRQETQLAVLRQSQSSLYTLRQQGSTTRNILASSPNQRAVLINDVHETQRQNHQATIRILIHQNRAHRLCPYSKSVPTKLLSRTAYTVPLAGSATYMSTARECVSRPVTCRVRVWVSPMRTWHVPKPGPHPLYIYPYPYPIPTHTTSLTCRVPTAHATERRARARP